MNRIIFSTFSFYYTYIPLSSSSFFFPSFSLFFPLFFITVSKQHLNHFYALKHQKKNSFDKLFSDRCFVQHLRRVCDNTRLKTRAEEDFDFPCIFHKKRNSNDVLVTTVVINTKMSNKNFNWSVRKTNKERENKNYLKLFWSTLDKVRVSENNRRPHDHVVAVLCETPT